MAIHKASTTDCEYLFEISTNTNKNDLLLNKRVSIYKSIILFKNIFKFLLNKNVYHATNIKFSNGLSFYVNKNVLIPRPETELLIEKIVELLKKYDIKPVILELGTGSGIISISLSKFLKDSQITAMEISRKALKVAEYNNKKLKTNIRFIKGDMLCPLNEKFSVIVSNPPYIGESEKIDELVYNTEPHLALFAKDNGLFFYKEIIPKYYTRLNKRGLMAFEIGENQGQELLIFARKVCLNCKIWIEQDYNLRDRYLFILKK